MIRNFLLLFDISFVYEAYAYSVVILSISVHSTRSEKRWQNDKKVSLRTHIFLSTTSFPFKSHESGNISIHKNGNVPIWISTEWFVKFFFHRFFTCSAILKWTNPNELHHFIWISNTYKFTKSVTKKNYIAEKTFFYSFWVIVSSRFLYVLRKSLWLKRRCLRRVK